MSHPVPTASMSYDDYLALEAESETRHEYLAGNVSAMAGGTPEHGALAAALIGELRNALRGKPCRVFTSDVRLRIRETGLSTYPDISVVCGRLETDDDDRDAIVNPLVVVEVLSDSTEAYDRGAKASHYRRLRSLAEYVFVVQDEPRIEVNRRIDGGHWALSEARSGETIQLASLNISLSVDAIYADPLASAGDDAGPR